MQVLDHHDQRLCRGEVFEESPPRAERFRAVSGLRLGAGANERAQLAQQPLTVGRVIDEGFQCRRQLSRRFTLAVRLSDPRLSFDDLTERPERDPFAIGKIAALPPPNDLGLICRHRPGRTR